MVTRARAKAQEIEHLLKTPPRMSNKTEASIETGNIMSVDILAELRKSQEDISTLLQRASAAEERVFQMQSKINELKAQFHVDITFLYDQASTEKQRLTEVDRHGKRLYKTMRNQMRDERSSERAYVKTLDQVGLPSRREVDEDSQSTVSFSRVEAMTQALDEARS